MADIETLNLFSISAENSAFDNASYGIDDGNEQNGKSRRVIKEFADLVSNLQSEVFVSEYTGDVEDEERGRQLFFNDEKKRIDYVLVWSNKEERHAKDKQQERTTFEENLREEGLILEEDVEEGRAEQYTKVHVPLEVLRRYAETMKIRMPINKPPEDAPDLGIWDKVQNIWTRLVQLFALNEYKVPHLKKRFTHVFDRDKRYLFYIPDNEEHFFSHATRSRIVDYILRRKEYKNKDDRGRRAYTFGIKRLLANGTYLAAYPLHEGGWKADTKPNIRKMLYNNWATWRVWYKLQPLDYIRVYFGEKIGLYFAWLGYYTYSLILPSFIGLLVFLYGVLTVNSDTICDESCNPNNAFIMCPLCDKRCNYWSLDQICLHVKATHMFDNGATVFFAIFMSVWAVFFLEFWKREEKRIQFLWDLKNFEQEEEPPRPEYFDRLAQSPYIRPSRNTHGTNTHEEVEHFHPFWRRKVPVFLSSASIMLTMLLIAIAAIIGIVFYRISVLAALYAIDDPVIYQNANLIVTATAAVINLIIIFILDFFYTKLAVVLTDWECLRTQSEYDNSLTLKLYVLQFVNYYSTLFYIAFFKGRFVGSPARPMTFISARQEECQGSCLTELCIQLAIVFVGKQLIQNNLVEIYLPRIKRWVKKKMNKSDFLKSDVKPWVKDYTLEAMGSMGLFNEYLEMMIQFGFVTLFVAAFPLAPFFALLNNIIELRADANKFVTQYRREMASRTATIGIWYGILYGLSRFAIVTNALIIAFTSSFIHRELYKAVYSPDGSLHGFVNNSLSYFAVSDFPVAKNYSGRYNDTEICRYSDYREPPWTENKYEYTTQYWTVVAVQFIFVVVFENVVIFLVGIVAYLIPDVPAKVKEQMRREAEITNDMILKTELSRARGGQDADLEALQRSAISDLDELSGIPGNEMLEMAAHKFEGSEA